MNFIKIICKWRMLATLKHGLKWSTRWFWAKMPCQEKTKHIHSHTNNWCLKICCNITIEWLPLVLLSTGNRTSNRTNKKNTTQKNDVENNLIASVIYCCVWCQLSRRAFITSFTIIIIAIIRNIVFSTRSNFDSIALKSTFWFLVVVE